MNFYVSFFFFIRVLNLRFAAFWGNDRELRFAYVYPMPLPRITMVLKFLRKFFTHFAYPRNPSQFISITRNFAGVLCRLVRYGRMHT